MLHSALYPAFSAVSGAGIVASRDIHLGTVVWGPCANCRVWDVAQLTTAIPAVVQWLDEYGYRLADGKLILPCGGAHLLNHSCEATVLDYGLGVGIAVRDAKAGEEITIDYRTFRHELSWEFACSCGTPACVGKVRSVAGSIPATLVAAWQERIAPALERARNLPQEIPLREGSVVVPPTWSNRVRR
ncbi:MAG: SET domain-containing protein-lysine N-methyltransferase [Paraburkholderia sp.]|nr:MAG: SET domain-containing protein-lysine N-methyltransferase [Paraburkholderia sp.]